MLGGPSVETDRLRMVPFTEEHLTQRYVDWLNDIDVVRYSEQRHRRHNLESCRAYLQSYASSDDMYWAILTRDAVPLHIGNINALINRPNALADVGILIGEKRVWGKGYGAEAWNAVCRRLIEHEGIRKVSAGTLSVNHRMLSIMRRAGMIEDGIRRCHYLWEDRAVDVLYYALFREHSR